MSLFARPSVTFAIVFGCFAVLVPRVFLPYFRPRASPPPHHIDDHFRRPRPPMSRGDNDDTVQHLRGSPSHLNGPHPNMRGPHPGVNSPPQLSTTDQNSSKSVVTFALPMYTVGIAIFFIYTCFKYWAKRNTQEDKIKLRYSTDNIQWNTQKKKFKYNPNTRPIEDDEGDEEEESYAGLDPDYVEYLKSKRQKEREAKQALTADQRQMHCTLDDMKNSLSFISSKLETNQTRNSLSNNEITQLQDRLASTEAQMYKILTALDAASNQVNQLSKNTRQSLEQPPQTFIKDEEEEEEYHLSSHSESEGSGNDEENSNSDENSFPQEEQMLFNNQQQQEAESSSSYEEDEEVPNIVEEDDGASESSSERYGVMNTNYTSDPTTIEDYELEEPKKPEGTSDSRTKVQEWHQRNHSQSLSSSNSSIEQDQSIPTEEQNRLTRRKPQN